MRVFLSSQMFDPAGHGELELMPDGLDLGLPRRATRTATLDGGAIMDDAGFTVADAVLTIKARRLRESERLVKHLQQYHNRVSLSANEGFFICGGMNATFTADTITIRLLPLEGTL